MSKLPDELEIDCGAFGMIRRTSPPAKEGEVNQALRHLATLCVSFTRGTGGDVAFTPTPPSAQRPNRSY